MRAGIGDWIIRGIRGEIYPCQDGIFRSTYEAIDDQQHRQATPDLIEVDIVTGRRERISINGVAFPWAIEQNSVLVNLSPEDLPTVSLTLIANRVGITRA